ncbi:ABC transporter ATP-binding protein [Nocardioides baekrokdamisoli]|uniref:ABC transporter ATP-binding protein n=1 Tax=Nocardioides baekrokdamisoli TaxID=1804624 RepID=A0A3G9IR14_9ACTN|nr:metal ABC transporter ATP-binding protein [Nocardioides baekrokdamisoli]BBH16071.1 ABC transporter ATP-binding protein [Nocardioides baekrokdamisoli]
MNALELRGAGLSYGSRTLWSGLDLTVEPGEFIAVLGANGSGKTSLLRAILGLQPLTHGSVLVAGQPPRKASRAIGYVPQHRRLDPITPLRGKDVVRLGLDGHRWGPGWLRGDDRQRISAALEEVDATSFAEAPVGELSGGEQQRVRIAQAVASDPAVLLCDEPLLTLDLASQRTITSLIDRRRRARQTAVLFVTHEINPVLPYVDRVLYLAGGQFRVGPVDEVLTSATLSTLYGAEIEVVRSGDRILVAGLPEQPEHAHDHCIEPEGPLG